MLFESALSEDISDIFRQKTEIFVYYFKKQKTLIIKIILSSLLEVSHVKLTSISTITEFCNFLISVKVF